MIIHLRNQARAAKLTPRFSSSATVGVGVNGVDATLRRELAGLFHLVEEQAHSGTVEEREVAETVELTQADDLLAKASERSVSMTGNPIWPIY